MLNVDIVEINDEQSHNARILAGSLSSVQARKRGMIDLLGINCAIDYLQGRKIKIDTKKSVYKIPILYEQFKISDIYYKNYRIDVITLYKEKNIKIPNIHVDMDIMPDFYFIVQIGTKIKEAKMLGFIEAQSVKKCSCDSKYYYPTLDLIMNLREFQEKTKHSLPTKAVIGKHTDCMGLFLKFIDDDLSSVYKRQLIQHLMNCDSCRARFKDMIDFENLANNIRHYPDLMRKGEILLSNYENEESQEGMSLEEGINNLQIQDNKKEDVVVAPQTKKEEEQKPKSVQMFDLLDKNDKKVMNKKVIDAIFNEVPKLDFFNVTNVMNAKNRRFVISAVTIIMIFASFALISFKGSSDIIEENKEIERMEAYDDYQDDYGYSSDLSQNTQAKNVNDFIIKQPISTDPQYAPSINKITWEAPESVIKKESYVKFLQSIGKNIKLNLQNDLLLVSDIPLNKTVKADIKISSNGDVEGIKISQTSGSRAIDSTIIKVVKDTLTYMRPPGQGIISKTVDITLIIEVN